MRKNYLLLVCALILTVIKADAQCSMSGRYNSYVFPGSTVTSVSYTNSSDPGMIAADSMDIYQPIGDTFRLRPVLIMAHGGSFTSGSRKLDTISGGVSASDPCVDTFCLRFARRGYVTVSIDYRITDETNMIAVPLYGGNPDSPAYAVARAISDGKAAMRFLCANAATYKIDTNNMFIGGNSAGAVLYMHVGYLDSVGACTPLMYTALMNNGGFNGNSGYGDYTPKAKGVVSMAGGLASVSLVSPGGIPSVNAQGSADNIVPYTCNGALSGVSDTLCGLGSLLPQYIASGINYWDTVFAGLGHVPWDSDPGMMNSVDSLTNAFMYSLVCSSITSVNNVPTISDVALYPNPASEVLNIHSSDFVSSITLYDEMGHTVLDVNNINKESYQVNTSNFAKGVYFIRIRFTNESDAPMIRQVAIQ